MDEDEDIGGPEVVILEHMYQQAKVICSISSCYLGHMPPSALVYVDDAYSFSDRDVSEVLRASNNDNFTDSDFLLRCQRINKWQNVRFL